MSVRPPCPSCPWRVDQDATTIPNFRLDLAEDLADTCGRQGADVALDGRWFACHHCKPDEEFPCAGWLAATGWYHIGVRIAVSQGRVSPEALEPGENWPELHADYDDVLEKLRTTV